MAKSKISTAMKKEYEEIKGWNPRYNNTLVFHIAAAIGIRDRKQKEITGKRTDLINVPEVDTTRYLRSLLMTINPELEEEDYSSERFFVILEQYAEYGVGVLYEELTKTGTISLTKHITKPPEEPLIQ